MDTSNLVGIVAGTLTTIAFIPQVYKTWKSKSAKDLSLSMFSIFFSGVCLWLVYGIIENKPPIIAANATTLFLSGILLFFKFRFKN